MSYNRHCTRVLADKWRSSNLEATSSSSGFGPVPVQVDTADLKITEEFDSAFAFWFISQWLCYCFLFQLKYFRSMRNSARPLQQIRYLYCFYRTDISLNKAGKIDKASIFVNPIACHPNGVIYGRENNKDLTYSMLFSRALCSTSEKFSIRDSSNVGGVGPLLEYEKRIVMGELVGGDSFQIESLRALQRLYEELVEHEDDYQLDRYLSSKKSGRSRWLWSRLMPRSNYSPIKGLYLYGGVGTGKTMLMDLFYNQLFVSSKFFVVMIRRIHCL
ncbi:hypothetical protein ZIOFF_028978 [Zingiber officinale]|uniref:Uncharacterized protein n=1 Tax=Zingiber officinale TaxID=94328 RepID=A0A8J5GVX5_ZINOF|nr:hypothetical protein ZIOFF_028978 [Zingiber officinale]